MNLSQSPKGVNKDGEGCWMGMDFDTKLIKLDTENQ